MGLLLAASCAPKRSYVAAPVPDWDVAESLAIAPPGALSSGAREDFRLGWTALREGRLAEAADKLEDLRPRYGDVPQVSAALGFLELRLGRRDGAERDFERALMAEPDYGPAESGLVLVALAESNEELAYQRLLRLEKTHPQHVLVDRYGMMLRVNVAELRLREARELGREGRHAEAAEAYLKALEVAPEAGALYLETAREELAADMADRAVLHARRATELEPRSAEAFRTLGDASYARGDLVTAVAAYREASSLSPGDEELRSRLEVVEREFEREHLPAQYLEIPDATRLTREQLAALLYVKLRSAFDEAERRSNVIAMDISDSWASAYIRRVVGAGVLEVFPNHLFQPRAFVTRLDLARALDAALEALAPEVREAAIRSDAFAQEFTDLPRENPDYEAAAVAVSLGLLPPGEGGGFDAQAFVSGAEAARAVDALAAHMTP